MISKDFLKYILSELAARPHLLQELEAESVVVNRSGTDGYSLESLVLNENEVLGKRDGKLVGIPYSGESEVVTEIGPDSTGIVLTKTIAQHKSSKFVIDILTEAGDPVEIRSTSFEMLIRVDPNNGIEYTRYAILGNSLNIDFEFASMGDTIMFSIYNSESLPIKVYVRVLK